MCDRTSRICIPLIRPNRPRSPDTLVTSVENHPLLLQLRIAYDGDHGNSQKIIESREESEETGFPPHPTKKAAKGIPMVGKVHYDETKLGYITAWVAGRLDRLYVDFTGVEVKKGDHMVYIYSEQLYAAQEELIQALKYAKRRPAAVTRLGISDIDLVESARKKLRLLGLKEDHIKEIETLNTPTDRLPI